MEARNPGLESGVYEYKGRMAQGAGRKAYPEDLRVLLA
jgi:hypothetical protein